MSLIKKASRLATLCMMFLMNRPHPLTPSPTERGSAGNSSPKDSVSAGNNLPTKRGSAGNSLPKEVDNSKPSSSDSENAAPSLKERAGGEAFFF